MRNTDSSVINDYVKATKLLDNGTNGCCNFVWFRNISLHNYMALSGKLSQCFIGCSYVCPKENRHSRTAISKGIGNSSSNAP
jgi:hypothetical protein